MKDQMFAAVNRWINLLFTYAVVLLIFGCNSNTKSEANHTDTHFYKKDFEQMKADANAAGAQLKAAARQQDSLKH